MTVYVYGEPVRVTGTLSDGMYTHSYAAERLMKEGAGEYPAVHYFMEASTENVRDAADALKRLSMEPRSEKLRIAVVEQLRRVLR